MSFGNKPDPVFANKAFEKVMQGKNFRISLSFQETPSPAGRQSMKQEDDDYDSFLDDSCGRLEKPSRAKILKMEKTLHEIYPMRLMLETDEHYSIRCQSYHHRYRCAKKGKYVEKVGNSIFDIPQHDDSEPFLEKKETSPVLSNPPVDKEPLLEKFGEDLGISTPTTRFADENLVLPVVRKRRNLFQEISPMLKLPPVKKKAVENIPVKAEPLEDEDVGNIPAKPESNEETPAQEKKLKPKHQRPNRRKKMDASTQTAAIPTMIAEALCRMNREHLLWSPPVREKKKNVVKKQKPTVDQ